MKRIWYLLIILGVIGLVILLGYFLRYRLAYQPSSPSGSNQEDNSIYNNLFGTGSQQGGENQNSSSTQGQDQSSTTAELPELFGLVSDLNATDYYIYSKKHFALVQPDGKVVEITDSNPATISSTPITKFIASAFSYDGKKIMAVFGDEQNLQVSIFSLESRSWSGLPEKVDGIPVWSPSSYDLAYLKRTGDTTNIEIFNTQTKKKRTAATFHFQDIAILWSRPDAILIKERGSAYTKTSAWIVELSTQKVYPIARDVFGLDIISNADLSSYLQFTASELRRGGELSLLDGQAQLVKKLSFTALPTDCVYGAAQYKKDEQRQSGSGATTSTATSSVSKNKTVVVVPSEPVLVCAIIQDQNSLRSKALPDLLYRHSLPVVDAIRQINLASGAISTLFEDDSFGMDAQSMRIFFNHAFFINRSNSKLYHVPLNQPDL